MDHLKLRVRLKRKPRTQRKRGTALVEMAFLLPVLLLVLFGMIEYGGLFWRASQLESAARTAVRAGALSGGTTSAVNTTISSMMTAAGLSSSGYTVTLNPTDPSALASGAQFMVTISVPYPNISLTKCPLVPTPATLTRSCTMAKEGG
jgi:Flp pilus assembly protein TadG